MEGTSTSSATFDVEYVGTLGEEIWTLVSPLTSVKNVYVVAATWQHVLSRHETQLDFNFARSLLAALFADPIYLYHAPKPGSLIFVASYDEEHYLIVPVKVLENELWVESMFLDRRGRLLRRLQKRILLYARSE